MGLSQRLGQILALAKGSHVLADIGTDHAYLPIEACRLDICQKAIACDINQGPLKIATANIQEAAFTQRIETRLGDGLEPLGEGEADTIVISGMGGIRMWHILQGQATKAQFAKKLILQPQHNLEELRRYLHGGGYQILDEQLVMESDTRFYVILVAHYTGVVDIWTAEAYILGKFLSERPHYLAYLQYHHQKMTRYIQDITCRSSREIAVQRLAIFSHAIAAAEKDKRRE